MATAPPYPQSGLSLLELLISMTVLLVSVSIALPSFSRVIEEHRSEQVVLLLYGLIQKSRHHAITHNSHIVLCKSHDLSNCGGSWKDGILVFIDTDGNHSLSGNDVLLQTIRTPFHKGELHWRSFGNKSHLEFLPSGSTNYQNGTFTYCIDKSDVKKARGISITVTGRPQIAFDRNGDGVRENSSGTPLRC